MYDGGVNNRRLLALAILAVATVAVAAPSKKTPWKNAPGPIQGRRKATSPGADGMIVAFTVDGTKAVGHVDEPGAASAYGYKKGEEILRLEADDYGDWVGQLEWRSVGGTTRWDPIRFRASDDLLDATMTTSECYRHMPRVR
jgi:hypothetical protein